MDNFQHFPVDKQKKCRFQGGNFQNSPILLWITSPQSTLLIKIFICIIVDNCQKTWKKWISFLKIYQNCVKIKRFSLNFIHKRMFFSTKIKVIHSYTHVDMCIFFHYFCITCIQSYFKLQATCVSFPTRCSASVPLDLDFLSFVVDIHNLVVSR